MLDDLRNEFGVTLADKDKKILAFRKERDALKEKIQTLTTKMDRREQALKSEAGGQEELKREAEALSRQLGKETEKSRGLARDLKTAEQGIIKNTYSVLRCFFLGTLCHERAVVFQVKGFFSILNDNALQHRIYLAEALL